MDKILRGWKKFHDCAIYSLDRVDQSKWNGFCKSYSLRLITQNCGSAKINSEEIFIETVVKQIKILAKIYPHKKIYSGVLLEWRSIIFLRFVKQLTTATFFSWWLAASNLTSSPQVFIYWKQHKLENGILSSSIIQFTDSIREFIDIYPCVSISKP